MNWHIFWQIILWVYIGIAMFNILMLRAIWDPSSTCRWLKILIMGVLWPVFAILGLVVIVSDFYMPNMRGYVEEKELEQPTKETK